MESIPYEETKKMTFEERLMYNMAVHMKRSGVKIINREGNKARVSVTGHIFDITVNEVVEC